MNAIEQFDALSHSPCPVCGGKISSWIAYASYEGLLGRKECKRCKRQWMLRIKPEAVTLEVEG